MTAANHEPERPDEPGPPVSPGQDRPDVGPDLVWPGGGPASGAPAPDGPAPDGIAPDRPAPDRPAPDGPAPGDPAYLIEPAWPAPPRPPRRPGRAAAVAVAVVVAVTALGAPLGLLWAAVAPSVPVRMGEDGALLAESQPEQFIAADGWFTLLGFGFGVLAAVAVWQVVRRRGPLPLLAVTLGAVGAGLLAWWLGRHLGVAEYERLLESAPVGAEFGKPADLRAADADLRYGFLPVVRGNALVPALGAAVAYALLAGWSRFPTLRAGDEPEPGDPFGPPLSWDSTAPPDPPAAPARPAPGAAAPPPG